MNGKKRNVGGKPPKPDKASHPVMVRFTNEEYARFLAMYEQSGVYAKAVFIKARVFGAEFRVLKVDKTLVDYYTKLSSLHAQYRAVGVNYNQTVKELKSRFRRKGDGTALQIGESDGRIGRIEPSNSRPDP